MPKKISKINDEFGEYPTLKLPDNMFIKNVDDSKRLFKTTGVYPYVSDIPKEDVSHYLQRRKMLGGVKEVSKKLPGPFGKGVALGVLGVEAASEGIKKLRSMEGRDADPEIPSEVENKSKGGSIMARGNKLARMKPTKMY